MTTINLPVGTIQSIVNIDDPRVNIPIEDAFNFMQSTNDDKKLIRGMESTVELKSKTNNNQEFNVLNFKHDINYIVKLRKLPILNPINVTYYKVKIRYFNEKEYDFVIPSYVKFYSATTKQLVPIEYINKSDILYDWQGFNAQVRELEETDFKPTEYYNMIINSPNDISMNFYFNGILGYVSYINFSKEMSK
jgi:hypothetical protein